MRIVFMGTPDFAVLTLRAILDAGHEVVAVYSQPPRAAGRGMALRTSPVQQAAEQAGLAVRTPQNLKSAVEQERFLALNADAHAQVLHVLQDVVSGRVEVTSLLRGREQGLQARAASRVAPIARTDNEASGRYTILDIVAGNAIGLLYRISRVISQHGCDVDLVLISTEGERAIDVFHITRAGAKLTEAEQHALTADLQRTLEGPQ